MFERKKMGVQRAYLVMATMFVASVRGAGAIVVHAAIDLGRENSEFLQLFLKQMETLANKEQEDSKVLSQSASEVASPSASQQAATITIKGNITDSASRLTLTFTVHASRPHYSAAATDDEDDDEEDDEWRSSSGVLSPIVDVVEPYFLSFVELVFNGILSSVISSFLESANPLGDVRLI